MDAKFGDAAMNSWISFQCEEQIKLAPLLDHITVGSAESNPIKLVGRGVQPLHGQFVMTKEGRSFFRDFAENSLKSLENSEEISVGGWIGKRVFAEEIWEIYGNQILNSFKEILKEDKEASLSNCLERIKGVWFSGKKIPEHVEEKLFTQFNELSLWGPIETLLEEPAITDILVIQFDEIWVEESGELKKSSFKFLSEESYKIYLENLLSRLHKHIDENIPFLDFILPNGSRGHLMAPPLTPGSYYLSIRKTRRDFFQLKDLSSLEMFSAEALRLIQKSLDRRENILISGATGSGKTTLMKALLHACPEKERIVVCEDTPELSLPRANTAFLYTRNDSKGNLMPVGLRELIRQTLRMRPDRIVLGEVRGEEALDLLHAMNTGHRGCMGSLHANSARDALFRLQGLAQMSSANLSEPVTRDLIARNIHLILHCGRDENGKRRVEHLAYVRGLDQSQILLEVQNL
jgi:pilus assembly protein CpaF